MAFVDKRRTDQRVTPDREPIWITSAEIDRTDDDDATVLFSFPGEGRQYCIHSAALEVIEAFDSTPVLVIGQGTLPTDSSDPASASVTPVDADEFFNTTSAAPGSTGVKYPSNTEDCIDLIAGVAGKVIVGADSTVPVIYANLTATGTVTTGRARLHLLISEVPLIGA